MRPPLTLRGFATRRNSVMLIPIVIAICLLGAFLWHGSDGIRHAFESPQPMTRAQLSAMGNDAGRWIELTADVPPRYLIQTATPTGHRGSVVVLSYFALAKDFTSTKDRMIIVVTGRTELPATFVGRVVSEDSNNYAFARSELYKRKGLQFPQAPLAPVLLDTPSWLGHGGSGQ